MDLVNELSDLATQIVAQAKGRGADVAEVLARDSAELSAKVRLGAPELVEEARSRALGLRVLIGGKSGLAYTSDVSAAGLALLVDNALELATLSEADPLADPPDPDLLAKSIPDLDLYDDAGAALDAHAATELALTAEAAARGYDSRITNSEGATCGRTRSATVLVTSGGFSGGYRSTSFFVDVSPVTDDADGKKRSGGYWDSRRKLGALERAEAIGQEAARRTLRMLGAAKIPSAELPVVFDPDAGRALLSTLFSCLSGSAIYQRASYLLGREQTVIASPLVNIVDDATLPGGPASRPFDGEGLASRRTVVVEAGVLKTYLMDSYSARKLGKSSTGSAARGVGSRPSVSPTNFHLLPQDRTPSALISEVPYGLYVTSMMGFGFNPVTGDFSRGAEGLLIENGQLTRPVGEITISLNLDTLLQRIDAVANDLLPRSGFAAPTFRVSQMTIAGA